MSTAASPLIRMSPHQGKEAPRTDATRAQSMVAAGFPLWKTSSSSLSLSSPSSTLCRPPFHCFKHIHYIHTRRPLALVSSLKTFLTPPSISRPQRLPCCTIIPVFQYLSSLISSRWTHQYQLFSPTSTGISVIIARANRALPLSPSP